jgi:hypothetical protein
MLTIEQNRKFITVMLELLRPKAGEGHPCTRIDFIGVIQPEEIICRTDSAVIIDILKQYLELTEK